MNIEEYLRLKEDLFLKANVLSTSKGHDYSGEADTLRNLKAPQVFGIPPAKGVLVRLMDKIMRLNNFLDQGELQVKNEQVEDTVIDGINYLTLFYAILRDEQT